MVIDLRNIKLSDITNEETKYKNDTNANFRQEN